MFVAFNCKNGNCQNWYSKERKYARDLYENVIRIVLGNKRTSWETPRMFFFLNMLGRHKTGRAQL